MGYDKNCPLLAHFALKELKENNESLVCPMNNFKMKHSAEVFQKRTPLSGTRLRRMDSPVRIRLR